VELRQRGDGAREHPKHSWKTRHPTGGETHLGAPGAGSWAARTRNYLAEYGDGGYLSDPFAYGLMLGAGVRSPRWRFVTLDVNGEHQGVYVEVQEPDDKHFLRDHGFHEDSTTYRCGLRDCEMKLSPPASYQGQWEKETNETAPWDDLWTFPKRTPKSAMLRGNTGAAVGGARRSAHAIHITVQRPEPSLCSDNSDSPHRQQAL
jgi:spore coat protein H